ncbi:DUF6879 family protein [Promicromonospora sp. NPDC059942]|uniref:DUF6879 family protein n=1 Tax=Promicromonospora sp. NPDC059942 TaxID=3347009 RepID=UPI003668DB31
MFQTFEHSAFRLEVRDDYNSPAEQEPLGRWLRDGDLDQGWRAGWFEQLATWQREGKRFHRVRVVSVPLTPYSEWAIQIAGRSNAEGDDIRYLDRADAGTLPDYDYWLFDSRLVAKMHFADDDEFVGFELIDDPAVVVEHNYWRDAAVHASTTRDEFATKHSQQR